MHDFEYKKHIQFLRGLSVIFVFLYHTNITIFNKGYLGVDIFFVISGFVITQKIFQNYFLEKKINLIGFYSKRFKRIIPNLFFIIGVTYLTYLIFGPPDLSLFSETLSALFGVSNLYYIVHDAGYFDNIFDDPLAHTWSLGVEEQFYLIYPLLIFIIYLFKNNKQFKLQTVLFIIFFLSLFFFRKELETDPIIAFFLSPLRFWEFIFGGILFLNYHKIKKNNYISFASLSLLIFLILNKNDYDYFYLNLIIVLLSGIFIVFFVKSNLLVNKSSVYFGDISYSFYLWHLPVLFFLNLYVSNKYFLDVTLSFFVTILLSIITYHLIEQKFRYLEFKKLRNYFYFISPIFLIIFVFLIYAKYFNDNLRKDLRSFVSNSNYLNKKHNWDNRIPFNDLIVLSGKKVYEHCTENSTNFTTNSNNLKTECLRQKNYKTLFFIEGNSYIAQFLPIFDKSESIDNIYYKHNRGHKVSVKEANEINKKFNEVIYITNVGDLKKLNIVISSHLKFDSDIKFILFNSTPWLIDKHQSVKCLIQQIDCNIDKIFDIKKRSLKKLFQEMENFRLKHKNVYIFDSYEELCPNRKCVVYDKDKDLLFYRDFSHLAVEGSKTLIPKFDQFIGKLKDDNSIFNY